MASGWGCKVCGHWNPLGTNNCQNTNCKTHPNQRKNNAWWKCSCGRYTYANRPNCDRCGKPKSTHCVGEGRG